MWPFYLIATLWFIAGAFFWVGSKRIVWWEWLAGTATAFGVAGIFHYLILRGMTDDIETWSGQVTQVRDYTSWTEYYEEAVYRTESRTGTRTVTNSKGQSSTETYTYYVQVFDHWEPTTRVHQEHWGCADTLGGDYAIDRPVYQDITARFGQEDKTPGSRTTSEHASKMIAGDPDDRVSVNVNGFVKPVTTSKHWENRVRAAPSTFSFRKVDEKAPVFDYPKNEDRFNSERLLGTALTIPLLAWDQMNARLGPQKHVNVIAIGFKGEDSSIADVQRAKYIGGKKNDLVICFGGPIPLKPTWVQCFGWTERDICKRNIETIFLSHSVNAEIVPFIEAEIRANYQIKDWKKFDYLSIEPPAWTYGLFFGVILALQGGLWAFFYLNDMDKETILGIPKRRVSIFNPFTA